MVGLLSMRRDFSKPFTQEAHNACVKNIFNRKCRVLAFAAICASVILKSSFDSNFGEVYAIFQKQLATNLILVFFKLYHLHNFEPLVYLIDFFRKQYSRKNIFLSIDCSGLLFCWLLKYIPHKVFLIVVAIPHLHIVRR